MIENELRNLPALSVRQPWAWLIVHGFKQFENRDWTPAYLTRRIVQERAPFRCLIHAASGMTLREYEACQIIVNGENVERESRALAPIALPSRAQLERGGIVGVVTILAWSSVRLDMPFSFGSGLSLDAATPLPFTPCSGALGLFQPRFLHDEFPAPVTGLPQA